MAAILFRVRRLNKMSRGYELKQYFLIRKSRREDEYFTTMQIGSMYLQYVGYMGVIINWAYPLVGIFE